jgi:hypothetical protein
MAYFKKIVPTVSIFLKNAIGVAFEQKAEKIALQPPCFLRSGEVLSTDTSTNDSNSGAKCS